MKKAPSPKRALVIAKRLSKAADLFGDGVGITALLKDAARALERLAAHSQTVAPTPQYLVWSNEHHAWWGPEERGYTRIIERAGRYTRSQAMTIASRRGGGWQTESNPYEIAIPEADAVAQYSSVVA